MANFKKTLMPEQAEALFKILQERFTKNMDRHENLEWQKPAASRMFLNTMVKRTATFFTTAQKKARRAEESYAMIRKRWKAER